MQSVGITSVSFVCCPGVAHMLIVPSTATLKKGYDDQGYERCGRRLHVRTGVDCNGYNRFGPVR